MAVRPSDLHFAQLPTTGQVTEEVVNMLASRRSPSLAGDGTAQTDDQLREVLTSVLGKLKDASKEEVVVGIWIALEDVRELTGLTLLQSLRQIGCRDEIDEQLVTDAPVEHLRTVLSLLVGLCEVVHAVAEHEASKEVVVASLRFGDRSKRAIDLVRRGDSDSAMVLALSYPPVFLDKPIAVGDSNG